MAYRPSLKLLSRRWYGGNGHFHQLTHGWLKYGFLCRKNKVNILIVCAKHNDFSLLCYMTQAPIQEHGMLIRRRRKPIISPKFALCQVWLKLAQWFWRGTFFNLVNVFSLFHYYLPLEKSMALHLKKFESPFLKHGFS